METITINVITYPLFSYWGLFSGGKTNTLVTPTEMLTVWCSRQDLVVGRA